MLSIAERARLAKLLKMKAARENLLDFILWTKPDYEVNWHHRIFAETLDRFLNTDEIPFLIVEAPARHGKSEIISRRFPAFAFGKNPDKKIISASYSADLASMMNRDVQRIIDDPAYAAIFPETKLNGDNVRSTGNWLRNSDIFEIVGRRGVYRCAGVGGGITGMGAEILLIDDPVKNQEEAESKTIREKIWDWFTTTAFTRLEKGGKVCLTMTRWHDDDLAGRLLKQAAKDKSAPQWHVLKLPAIATENKNSQDPRKSGEALWPNKYPIEKLNQIRLTVGERVFSAMFQQNPTNEGGGMFAREHWRRFNDPRAMASQMDVIIQSWDLAFKKSDDSDFVAGHVWGKKGPDFYLLDVSTARRSFTESVKAVRALSEKWPQARGKLVEAKANGEALVDVLKKEIPGLILVEPKGGKIARAQSIAPFVEAGNVWIPNNAQGDAIIEQAAAFPNVAHDDDVDAMSQALIRLGDDPKERLRKLLGG